MSEHTAGEWRAVQIDSAKINIRASVDSIALVYVQQGSLVLHDREGEGLANARLIAAAPDLLAAAEFLLSFVPPWAKDVPEGLGETFYGTLSAEGDRVVKARVDAARDAIAKARGKQVKS